MLIPIFFHHSPNVEHCPECGTISQEEIRPLTESATIENKINWQLFRREHPILSLFLSPTNHEKVLKCLKCKKEFQKVIEF